MVKIVNISIRNFKFYTNDSIDISEKNFLIYGENGVGKSSLYLALYHLFYGYFDNSILEDILEFKNRNTSDDLNLEVNFSNDEKIEINNTSISNNSTILSKKNIYFLDYRFLEQFSETKDFFETLNQIKNRFLLFDEIFNELSYIEEYKESENYDLLINRRINLDSKIVEKLNKLKYYTNTIITELKEDFSIEFIFEESALDREAIAIKFHNPKIFIEVDGYKDLKLHFNESKIKILSLALVFAMIQLNQEENISENNEDDLKLLVLDDFLSSLDMGNRLYIMEYIFKHFKGYQKIILTHNLSFFSVIKRIITYHEEDNWIKNSLYKTLQEDGKYIPKLVLENNYLEESKKAFTNDKFEECGNLLRKEIERIIIESNILFVIGRKESLESVIKSLINEKKYFINPNRILTKIEKKFTGFKLKFMPKTNIPDSKKLNILVQSLNYIFQTPTIDSEQLNKILKDVNFYKDTILNKASHHTEEEHYRKEYDEAIKDVQKLKNIFDEFNKLQKEQ